jgi:type 1 glutamine amidotransferase
MGCRLSLVAGLATGLAAAGLTDEAATPKRLLVVSVTKGYRHESIATAEKVLQALAESSGAFALAHARSEAELIEKAAPGALEAWAGIVFANTTGELPLPRPQALLDWVAAGGAFVGIHSASDTFHGFPPYLAMLGGEFDHHGEQARVEALVQDPDHPATRELGRAFTVHDEIYLFKGFDRSRVRVLLALDRHPNSGAPGFFPLAWTREHGRGRVFYTALGHREDVLQSDWYGKHLLGGIRWALETTPAGPRPTGR